MELVALRRRRLGRFAVVGDDDEPDSGRVKGSEAHTAPELRALLLTMRAWRGNFVFSVSFGERVHSGIWLPKKRSLRRVNGMELAPSVRVVETRRKVTIIEGGGARVVFRRVGATRVEATRHDSESIIAASDLFPARSAGIPSWR